MAQNRKSTVIIHGIDIINIPIIYLKHLSIRLYEWLTKYQILELLVCFRSYQILRAIRDDAQEWFQNSDQVKVIFVLIKPLLRC